MADDRQQALDAFLAEGAQPAPEAVASAPATAPSPEDPRRAALDGFLDGQRKAGHAADVAGMMEQGLEANARIRVTPAERDTALGWLGRVGRSATFNAADLISAKFVQNRMRSEIPDITYAESLRAVREGFKADPSVTADIAGMLVPGVAIGKGVERGWQAATQSGLAEGAVRWAIRHPKMSRIVGAIGAGGAGGAVEEAVRTSVDESIGAVVGDDFDAARIVDSTITGALVGGMVGGGLQTLARGAGNVPGALDVWDNLFKAGMNLGEVQSRQAAQRLYNAARLGDETPEEAATRLQDAATRFYQDRGYMPAMSDLMAPEDVREVADIVRYYSGLDRTSIHLSGERLDAAIDGYRRAINSGRGVRSTEQIEARVEDLFGAVSRQHGATPVEVADDVVDSLANSQAWIAAQAKHNPGARAILQVIEARQNVDAVRQRVGNLRNARNTADLRAEVAELDDEITQLLSDPADEAGARAEIGMIGSDEADDAVGALRNLRNILKARADVQGTSAAATRAQQTLDDVQPTLDAMDRALDDYRANGLRISLSNANHMRAAASRYTNRSQDLAEQDTARAVRDAIAPVGTAEVPVYGRMVRHWRDSMTRSDAQATGEAAASGGIDIADLTTRINRGRLPNRSGRATGSALRALNLGVRDGAVRTVRNAAQGTRQEAVASARGIADSPRVQQGLEAAAPQDAARIVGASRALGDTSDRSRAMAAPSSPSSTAEELAELREAALGVVFQNLGGAGRAGFLTRIVQRARLRRDTAERLIEMLGDPNRFDEAVKFMKTQGIDVGAVTGALAASEFGRGSDDR